ncbi:ISAzo13-like element transposase-related protein [Geminocystis sp. NIES-3709]|uniref:ISAzo13-like element transposase-related protein n=2 Tax=Geminocystis sp. NIES-3709 TaxID=1617448 RepID=UPI002101822C|nr:hypothetical protein [Geminocystis sp. NIES-3709]
MHISIIVFKQSIVLLFRITDFLPVETMLAWAKTMTWKGLRPIVNFSEKVYEKGISLTKKEMKNIEMHLERNPDLPKWDILIRSS